MRARHGLASVPPIAKAEKTRVNGVTLDFWRRTIFCPNVDKVSQRGRW